MNAPSLLFDRALVKSRRQRMASRVREVDYLLVEAATSLASRIKDTTRKFTQVLLIGAHAGALKPYLGSALSGALIRTADGMAEADVLCDEEVLPFAAESFDLIISCLSLHWVNDLPGVLAQIHSSLKPDGLFLAALPGPRTLFELRTAFEQAMLAEEGGICPVISPLVDVRDAGNLLQRAGFALPVADSETLCVSYSDPAQLLKELRWMGQANALILRRKTFLPRRVLAHALAAYQAQFADTEGRIPATFEMVYLSGWKPADTQQKPARRGSGQVSLRDAL